MGTRLRQIVLAAEHRDPVASELERELGLRDGFHDPGVGSFGLENVVYAVGDCFLEVVAPVKDGTTAGRLLAKDGPGGYMAIFQTDDIAAARARVDASGIRVVWSIELDDIAAMHLHPKDVPGAIVSVDQPVRPATWRWAGPAWIGPDVPDTAGGVTSMTVLVDDPSAAAGVWADVLGEAVAPDGDAAEIRLDGQTVRFEPVAGRRPGIAAFGVALPGADARTVKIGGAAFTTSRA